MPGNWLIQRGHRLLALSGGACRREGHCCLTRVSGTTRVRATPLVSVWRVALPEGLAGGPGDLAGGVSDDDLPIERDSNPLPVMRLEIGFAVMLVRGSHLGRRRG